MAKNSESQAFTPIFHPIRPYPGNIPELGWGNTAVARIKTVAFQVLNIQEIDVQIQTVNDIPTFTIIGLPVKAVGKSRERVRAALRSIGLALPPRRIVINLSPADVRNEGSHFILPIAVGVLLQDELE